MQGDGNGIAMRPEHRKNAGKADTPRGVPVADVRELLAAAMPGWR
jgi:hypothetical protein